GLNEGERIINLTGINDGEPIKSQELMMAVKSLDPTVAIASLTYVSPNTEGTLRIIPQKVGTTKIRVLVRDNGGLSEGASDSTYIEFTVNVKQVNALVQSERSFINVYPNPSNSQITVSSSGVNMAELTISDLSGRLLLQKDFDTEIGSSQLDVSNLTPGIYILTARGKETVLVTKFYKL
ncbi:MAG TPA: T9SS type A sorting domain-containing protein, partial [Cytophagaceae bacterium]